MGIVIPQPTETMHVQETPERVPPLQSGDRLNAIAFHRRYSQHPEIKKAELVEGVVYVGSPVYTSHSRPDGVAHYWFGCYLSGTPHVQMAPNTSVRLDNENEVQPDLTVWLDVARGGQIQETEEGLLLGKPDLIVEVAVSSASCDLNQKLRVYQRIGVPEYLVLVAYERKVHWYHLVEGVYQPIEPGEDGVLRSRSFPGLWLKPSQIWQGDFAGILALVQEGLKSEEHAGFVKGLRQTQAR